MIQRQNRLNRQEQVRNLSLTVPAALARYVGVGRPMETEAVADLIDTTPRTVLRYVSGGTMPGLDTGLRLMQVLPDAFQTELLLSIGLAGAFRVNGGCLPGDVLKEVVEGAAELAAAWADLRIDHTEWPTVRQQLIEAMVCIAQFLASEGRSA